MREKTALQILSDMEMDAMKEKYPGVPYIPVNKYSDKTANGLTKAIIKFLQLKGHQAERISVTGRRIDQRKTVTDVLGFKRQIGSVKWIKSSMTVGASDLSATISGRSVKIEIKVGKDRIRPAQEKYRDQVERAGGVYVIATTFSGFMEWYEEFTKTT